MAVDISSNSQNLTQLTSNGVTVRKASDGDEYEKITFIGTLGFQTSLFENDGLDEPIYKKKTIYIKKTKGERK